MKDLLKSVLRCYTLADHFDGPLGGFHDWLNCYFQLLHGNATHIPSASIRHPDPSTYWSSWYYLWKKNSPGREMCSIAFLYMTALPKKVMIAHPSAEEMVIWFLKVHTFVKYSPYREPVMDSTMASLWSPDVSLSIFHILQKPRVIPSCTVFILALMM